MSRQQDEAGRSEKNSFAIFSNARKKEEREREVLNCGNFSFYRVSGGGKEEHNRLKVVRNSGMLSRH